MQKILMTIVMLVMILPTFGQKLNSRGEKMVSSICCYYNNQLRYVVDFDYAKDGTLIEAVKHNGSQSFSLKKTQNLITAKSNNPKDVWSYKVRVDNNGRIVSIAESSKAIDGSGYCCSVRGLKYGYEKSLGKETLLADSCEMWYYDNKGDRLWREDAVNCQGINYREGNIWVYDYVRSYRMAPTTIHKIEYAYGDKTNDTNMNLSSLFTIADWSGFSRDFNGFLAISEWFPTYCKYLPIGETNRKGELSDRWEYSYYDGNVVGVKTKRYSYKINYVED